MTAHLSPARIEHAKRVLAHAEANAEGLLIHPRDLVCAVGSEADDMREIATQIAALAHRLHKTLQLALDQGGHELSERTSRDVRDWIDTIDETMTEIADAFTASADAFEENDRLPLDREGW